MQPPKISDATWVYDPLQADAYLLHLAATQDNTQVVAAESILSSDNILLVEKGAAITLKVAQNLQQFRLAKPIEDSVQLSWQLDDKELLEDMKSIMEGDDIFVAVNEHNNFLAWLAPMCQVISRLPLLQQKLTVMSLAVPDLYRRSLYATWLSLCIAKEMRLSQEDIATVLVAALGHDIGMLHVDAAILQRTTPLSAEDWMQIQRHVVIGARLLKTEQGLPSAVAQAVYEHHEQSDGTGYPLGKLENELGLFGQIINVADAIVAIHFNYAKHPGHSWRDVIPLIHMNAQAYLTRANEVLLAIVRRSDLPLKSVVQGDQTPEFIEQLLRKNQQLKFWFNDMRESFIAIGFRHGDRRLHALQTVMLHLATSAEGSGIFNNEKQAALMSPDGESTDVVEQVEKMHLMQQEIIFHLQRLSRMTELYLESGECKNNEIRFALTSGLQRSQTYLRNH